jgi:hypothetical protein
MSVTCRPALARPHWFRPSPAHSRHPPYQATNKRRLLCYWFYATAALLLGGYLLFVHGCHGDEDNELFAANRPNRPPVTALESP